MLQDGGKKVQDARADRPSEVIETLKLNEVRARLMKQKENNVRQAQKKEIKDLIRYITDGRSIINKHATKDTDGINTILRRTEGYGQAFGELSPQEIENNLQQIIFNKRKEVDRMNCLLKKKEGEMFKKTLEMEGLKTERKVGEPSRPQLKGVETAAQIQRIVIQQEAARIAHESYLDMKKKLAKDSRTYDKVIADLKADVLLQCKCVLKAFELGQTAQEEEGQFKKLYRNQIALLKKNEASFLERVAAMRSKLKFFQFAKKLMIPEPPLPVTQEEGKPVKIEDWYSEEEDEFFSKQVAEVMEELDDEGLLCEMYHFEPHRLLEKAEKQMELKQFLERQLEVAQIRVEYESKKVETMRFLKEDGKLGLKAVEMAMEADKEHLTEKLAESEVFLNESGLAWQEKSKRILELLMGGRLMMALLEPISLPIRCDVRETELNSLAQLGSPEVQLSDDEESYDYSDLESEVFVEEGKNPENKFYDIVEIKLKLMLEQLKSYTFTKEEEEEVEPLYLKYLKDNDALFLPDEVKEFFDPSPKKKQPVPAKPVYVPPPHCKCLTRRELLNISKKIVRDNEKEDPAQEGDFSVVKHVCY